MLSDKEIEKIVRYKAGKFNNEELHQDDLDSRDEININNRNFSGQSKNINLNDLRRFANIKFISLQYFIIDDSVAEILGAMPNLEILQLSSCKFTLKSQLKNANMKRLSLESCSIKDYSSIYAPQILRIAGQEGFRLDEIDGKENVEKIFIQNSTVKGFSSIDAFQGLQLLSLQGSATDNKEKIKDLREKINVIYEEEYLQTK